MQNASKVEFKDYNYDFIETQQVNIVNYNFEFINKGKSDFIIRKISSSCDCITATTDKIIYSSNENGKIHISFNSMNRDNEQQLTITLVTNDPENPLINLYISGYVKN